MALVNAIVEGFVDEAVSVRLISETGHILGAIYGKRGSGYIHRKLSAFNQSAQGLQYLALVDLMDTGIDCAPIVVQAWLPHPNAGMIFRVAVREIESWLLADREGIAEFLAIRTSRIPHFPEREDDPKRTLVNLARRSRRRSIREALVPKAGSSAATGRLYVSEMCRFIEAQWDVTRARMNSPSLDGSLHRLAALAN